MVVICGFKCESNHIAVMKMKSVAASAAPKPAFAEKESPGRMEFICVSDLLTAPLHDPQYDVWQMPPLNPPVHPSGTVQVNAAIQARSESLAVKYFAAASVRQRTCSFS